MKLRMAVAMFVLAIVASVVPLAAHHSVTAIFDVSKEVTIRGAVTKIDWTNPHFRFWVDARNDDGTVSNWELELAPPTKLKRDLGLDFIKLGDQVTVDLWQAKDGSRLGTHHYRLRWPRLQINSRHNERLENGCESKVDATPRCGTPDGVASELQEWRPKGFPVGTRSVHFWPRCARCGILGRGRRSLGHFGGVPPEEITPRCDWNWGPPRFRLHSGR